MNRLPNRRSAAGRVSLNAVIALAAVAALVLLLLYLQGTIGGHRIAPGNVPLATAGTNAASVAVERREVEDIIDWPGTVSSRAVASLAPKVMARIVDVRVNAGATVAAGDVIAVLDDREVQARAQQAHAAQSAAQAQAQQAEADLRRTRMLFQKQAATAQDLDNGEARTKTAQAQLNQARDAAKEADVLLGDTTLRAPFAGIVAARLADPGDMGVPGKPIAIIHDPQSLRLEVRVGERCSGSLTTAMTLGARIDSPARELQVRIDEIAPVADPQSRTVLVKAALPSDPSLRPGSFGLLQIPCGSHIALLVPQRAIRRSGQLETVRVIAGDSLQLRHVRSGKAYGDQVEIVSGLAAGERVVPE